MNNYYNDEEDENERPSHGSGAKPVAIATTAEEARRQFEQKQKASGDFIANSLAVETRKKDGKKVWLGFLPVPRGMEASLNSVVALARPYINRTGIDVAYKTTVKLFKKAAPEVQHSRGLLATKIFSGILIGGQPVLNLVNVYRQYNESKSDLLTEFASIIQDNPNYKNNEVIKTALQKIKENAKSGLWRAGADIPTLAATTMYGVRDYRALENTKNAEFKNVKLRSQPVAERGDELALRAAASERSIDEQVKAFEAIERNQPNVDDEVVKNKVRNFERRLRNLHDQDDEVLARSTQQESKSDDSQNSDMLIVMGVTGVASEYLKGVIDESGQKQESKVAAPEMILHFKKQIESQYQKPEHSEYGDDDGEMPERRDPSRMNMAVAEGMLVAGQKVRKGTTLPLKQFIAEIFQQNERDHKRDVIGQGLMTKLEPAIDRIAEVIADGRLDPIALVNLVGNGQVIIHKKGERRFASAEDVDTLIDKELETLSTREVINKKEFYSNFPDPKRAEETVKKNLETMMGKEKALFAVLFPDDILEQEGQKRSTIVAMRKEAHKRLYDFVAANAVYLTEKGPEYLKKLGLSEPMIKTLADFSEKVESGDVETIKQAVDGRKKIIIDAVRTAGLLEQLSGQEGVQYWTNREKEIDATHQKIKAAATKSNDVVSENVDDNEELSSEEKDGGFTKRFANKKMPHSARERESTRRSRHNEEPSEEVRSV